MYSLHSGTSGTRWSRPVFVYRHRPTILVDFHHSASRSWRGMPTVSVVDGAALGEISERLEPPGAGLQIAEHGLAGEELQAQLLGRIFREKTPTGCAARQRRGE
jgi:hypothetical protein